VKINLGKTPTEAEECVLLYMHHETPVTVDQITNLLDWLERYRVISMAEVVAGPSSRGAPTR